MSDMKYHPLAFDIDGVVGNIFGLFRGVAEERFGIMGLRAEMVAEYTKLPEALNVEAEVIRQVVDQMLYGEDAMKLEPYPGAVEVLTGLARDHRVLFVTARPPHSPIKEWVHKLLSEVDPARLEVVMVGQHEVKAEILAGYPVRAFVDDRVDTCYLISETGITPIVYDQPWNRHDHPFEKVENWAELAAVAERYSRENIAQRPDGRKCS